MERLRNIIANPLANEPEILWAASAAFFVEESPLNKEGSLKFAFGDQHDALEYLEFVLEAIERLEHNEAKLEIKVRTTHTCNKCMRAADIPPAKDNVLYVDLPEPPKNQPRSKSKGSRTRHVAEAHHLETLINGSSSPTDKKFCENCREDVPGVQEVTFQSSEVLILCLKRFDYSGKGTKNPIGVRTPLVLNYQHKSYRLRSQVDHVGATPRSGHYVTHKVVDGEVVTFSDTKITKARDNVLESKQSYLVIYSEEKAGEVMLPVF